MRKTLMAAAAVLALAAPVTLHAQAPAPAAATARAGMQIDANHIRATQLMDRDVYSTDNVEIGEIEDLIVDPATGRIVTAVVEVETRLGLTDKYVAVPLNQIRLTPGERRVTLNMTREQVNQLQGINYRD